MKTFSIMRLYRAFGYSLNGFKTVILQETAFLQECILTIFIIPAAIYISHSHIELILLCVSWLLVLFAELINSGIERCINRFGNDIHPISKEAKDIGSACVLLSIIIAVITWSICILH